MGSPLGLLSAVIPGADGREDLYTTVVSTAAELVAALNADLGDTFIKAGTYAVDLDLVALDTTPRRFVGAAESEVIITLTGTAPSSLDFTASLTDLTGVEWANVTFRSLSANATPALLTGCFAVENVTADLNALTPTGFSGCTNMVSCTVNINATVSATGFSACLRLVNCTVRNMAGYGFSLCTELSNCVVEAIATLDAVVNASAFDRCDRISSCQADYTSTTSAPSEHAGFFSCEQTSACEFLGPTGGAITRLPGYTSCLQVSACAALRGDEGFNGCEDLSGCRSDGALRYGFFQCLRLSGCFSGTSAINGFSECENLSACESTGNTFDGFETCVQLSACEANGNGNDGYVDCDNLSACLSTGNTATGFSNCTRVAGCTSTGDAAQVTNGSSRISFYSNNFQNIISPAQLTADVDDYAGILAASVARLDADALGPWTIGGIAASPAPHYSRYLRLINVSANDILIEDQSTSGSIAANQIITGTGASLTLSQNGVIDLWYDITTARWRVMQG
jgi:hypothetical protein